jgi:tRNA-(ms[2]io[6]A)-hydroxylase
VAFYEDLFASEARHYRTFVDLAESVKGDPAVVRQRLEGMARAEGELVLRLGTGPTMHG